MKSNKEWILERKSPKYELCSESTKGYENCSHRKGFNTIKMNADKMHEVLSSIPDLQMRSPCSNTTWLKIEATPSDRGHIMYYLPKFYCELNPIERVWAHAKQYNYVHKLTANTPLQVYKKWYILHSTRPLWKTFKITSEK